MAAIIDEKIYDYNWDMLTLTDEEYESIPKAKKFLVCITQTRVIIHRDSLAIECEKPLELPRFVMRMGSGDIRLQMPSSLITLCATTNYATHSNIASPYNDNMHNIVHGSGQYEIGGQVCIMKQLNDIVTHLYDQGRFIVSTFKNQRGHPLFDLRKIVKCVKYQDHLLAQYEDDPGTYLLLLCYSDKYSILCDIPFPSTMVKSARNS